MITFEPQKLLKSLNTIRNSHPSRKGDPVKVGKSLIDEVRRILRQSSPENLETTIYSLTVKQLAACVDIVAIDRNNTIIDRAAKAIELRPSEAMIPRIWFKLIRRYPHDILEKLLKMLVSTKGGNAIESHQRISKDAIRWLMADTLPSGIIHHYKAIRKTDDFDQFLSHHLLEKKDALFKIAWQTLLTKGTAKLIRQQDPKRIIKEIHSEIKSDKSMSMGQHYLNTLQHRHNFDEKILNYIHSKWKKPIMSDQNMKAEHRFWKNVSDTARAEFHKWLMIQEINEYFDGERADFWRPYVEKGALEDINVQEKGFLLQFHRFGVVEFKETGNAAYVYPIKHFMQFMNMPSMTNSNLADFKNKKQTIKGRNWDGRIIHWSGWQDTTQKLIKGLMTL
jgi:hypothetical protein